MRKNWPLKRKEYLQKLFSALDFSKMDQQCLLAAGYTASERS